VELRGLVDQEIEADMDELEMGPNNRAFMYGWDGEPLTHELIGGTLSYDVDIEDVGCACAAGVFAVRLDDDQCTVDSFQAGVVPQCASIDIMEANKYGFNVQSLPKEFDTVDPVSQCIRTVQEGEYGPSDNYTINSSQGYNVKTQFFATQNAQGDPVDLTLIRTTLSQDGREVILEQDCPDYLNSLSWPLNNNMAIAISTYNLDLDNDVSKMNCDAICDAGNASFRNVTFTRHDSLLQSDLIWGATTERLDQCEEGCFECRYSWYELQPENVEARCYDYTPMRFGGKCGSNYDRSACASDNDQLCHKSWPSGDEDRWGSMDAACRTVPQCY